MTLPHHLPIPELYVSSEAAAALARDAARLPGWTLEPRQRAELNLLLSGGFAPLRGYMSEAQHAAPLEAGWPVPLALAVSDAFAAGVQPGDDIALCDGAGLAVAVLSVTDRWQAGRSTTRSASPNWPRSKGGWNAAWSWHGSTPRSRDASRPPRRRRAGSTRHRRSAHPAMR